MAELILYTGRVDPELLERAEVVTATSHGASQPVTLTTREEKAAKKAAHAEAKDRFKKGRYLAQKVEQGKLEENFSEEDKELLRLWRDNTLLKDLNKATAQRGHGTLRKSNGEKIEIGGSTGGKTRLILDGYQHPNAQELIDDA